MLNCTVIYKLGIKKHWYLYDRKGNIRYLSLYICYGERRQRGDWRNLKLRIGKRCHCRNSPDNDVFSAIWPTLSKWNFWFCEKNVLYFSITARQSQQCGLCLWMPTDNCMRDIAWSIKKYHKFLTNVDSWAKTQCLLIIYQS